jgi:type II secretory pathway component PulF
MARMKKPMPLYSYKAKHGPGKVLDGRIEASSTDDAVDILARQGLTAVSLTECLLDSRSGAPFSGRPRRRISPEDIDVFTRQLAGLLSSGVPLLRGLSLICRQASHRSLAEVVAVLERNIRQGASFSQALEMFPAIFNDLFLGMVKAGEQGGSLAEALLGLAEYRRRERETRQKVSAALVYPVFMIVLGVLTVFLMLTFFLPRYVALFADMRQTLPLATRMLIGLSRFMSDNWYWFFALFFAVFLVLPPGGLRKGSRQKLFRDRIGLRLPLVSVFLQSSEAAKFARTLALLVKSGVPVCEGLHFAAEVVDNDIFRAALHKARLQVINDGRALNTALGDSGVLPPFALGMIAVGEENGRLEWALKDVAEVYEQEVEQSLKVVTTLIEPVLILCLGLVVGFIVFAMLLPIFNMSLVPTG